MKIAIVLSVSLICLCVAAGEDKARPIIACNLKAISPAERPKYSGLMKRLRVAVRARKELKNGYSFNLDSEAMPLVEIAEWMSMERLCCSFLTLQLSVAGNQPDWLLSITGPSGVKALLREEFHSTPR